MLPIGMPTRFGIFMELPPEFLKRKHAIMRKASMFQMPRAWQIMFMPEHFKIIASTKYAYKERTAKYLRRKAKSTKHHVGHKNPLAFSWKTKNQMTGQFPSITGTAKAATGVFRVPWYVKMQPVKRNAPNLGEELVRTTKLEAQELATKLGNAWETELRKAIPDSRKKWSIR